MKEYSNYSLINHNTFGIDAKAKTFLEYESTEELLDTVIPIVGSERTLHIGGGSNLLFINDFDGVVLHSCIKGIDVIDETRENVMIRVGAGESWDDVVAYTVEKGWSGAENLSLIPGEAGASAVQNIGAYGVESKDLITKVYAVELKTGERRVFENQECEYSYRKSVFKGSLKGRYAITHVEYRLNKTFQPELDYGNIRSQIEDLESLTPSVLRDIVIKIRKNKLPDPEEIGNAGSFFVNPVVPVAKYNDLLQQYPNMPSYDVDGGKKIPAGWMIEQCGWKGKTQGRAGVYSKQALVLINLGGASGQEVLALCNDICKSVYDKFGIRISPEVNIIE